MTTVPKEMSSVRTQRETRSRDLRDWMAAVDRIGELKHIDGADWEFKIGTVTEMGHHRGERSHALLFDDIKGYPKGYRVLSNTLNTAKRLAVTMHMDIKGNRLDIVRDMRERLNNLNYIPPQYVDDGPILENVFKGDQIDMWKFPTPKWHELDGGRYIGTGSVDITADPDTGWVNLGTYRVMIHDRDTLGFYISPGKQGRIMREKYFAKGQACKVAMSFGQDPLIYLAGGIEVPHGLSEYEWVGAVQGGAVPDVTGVWCHESGGARLYVFVSIKQRYPGHARQAGMIASYCHVGAYLGRYVIVVDDDIDVTNTNDVLWAMATRSDPESDIEIVRRSWSGPLDPVIPREKKGHNSRAIIDACRPYEWRDQFPPVAESSPEVRRAAEAKWGKILDE